MRGVSNCARYGESAVEVSLEREGSWAVIVVADDGPGIPEEELPFIFRRFYCGKGGNSGIGLSIVSAGLGYMGGKAQVENRKAPGHGAIYRLYLPVYLQD